jgi:phosphopantothenate-cysteine ligase
MPKCVLVTAGNTSEPIDGVRSITNTASGRLGSIIADAFISEGVSIVYVCGKNSVQPSQPTVETVTIEGVADLDQAIKSLSQSYSFDCIVHSMAVSDYTVKGILTYDELSEVIIGGAKPVISIKPDKINSDISNPVILLEKAPKVISKFKQLQPQALLVGFKLLVGVTEHELHSAAIQLMKKNGCDFVCANDLKNITQTTHQALLIDKDGYYSKLSTKQDIAYAIVKKIFDKWRNQT